MARQNLLAELQAVRRALMKGSDAYREAVSDKKTHALVINTEDIKNQVITQIKKVWGIKQVPPTLVAKIERRVNDMPAAYEKAAADINSKAHWESTSFKARLKRRGNNLYFIIVAKDRSGVSDVFAKISKVKIDIEQKLLNTINTFGESFNRPKMDSKNFLDAGHVGKYAVSMQRREVIKNTLSNHTRGVLAKEVEQIAIEMQMEKMLHGKGFTFRLMLVKPEAATENRGKEEERLLGSLTEQFEKVVRDRSLQGGWYALPGSDSPLDIRIKKILLQVDNAFKKIKGVKTNIKPKDIKIKDKKTKASVKRKTKGTIGTVKQEQFNSLDQIDPLEVESILSIRSLIPIVNEKLHDAIESNMGTPRLNYRTGRFARSAKVVDITETKAGYASFAYTYMRNPYQVFEFPNGAPHLATPNRDPRKLIDLSIRDIARELLMTQRFYTRRV